QINASAKIRLDSFEFTRNLAGYKFKTFIDGGFKGEPVFGFENLNFAAGSSFLDDSARVEIDEIAIVLNAYPDVLVEVSGHTDNLGDPVKNKELSQARATAVMNRLVEKGVQSIRMNAVGYGGEDPVAGNFSQEGRDKN